MFVISQQNSARFCTWFLTPHTRTVRADTHLSPVRNITADWRVPQKHSCFLFCSCFFLSSSDERDMTVLSWAVGRSQGAGLQVSGESITVVTEGSYFIYSQVSTIYSVGYHQRRESERELKPCSWFLCCCRYSIRTPPGWWVMWSPSVWKGRRLNWWSAWRACLVTWACLSTRVTPQVKLHSHVPKYPK